MLSLFRINDPLRLVIVFFLLLAIRLTFIFNTLPITVEEIKWILLGTKLSSASRLYIDIWDNTPPLPALLYRFLGWLWTDNQHLLQHLTAIILVMIQAIVFNGVLLRKNIHREKSYVPAILYVLLMSICIDFLTLSPLLISLTFLLFALRNLFNLNEKAFDEDVFSIGAYLGLAILCYLPNLLYLVFIFITITLFRTVSIRQYLLIIFGLLMTIGLTMFYYFWQGHLGDFMKNYLGTFFTINLSENYLTPTSFLTYILVFGLLLFLGLFKTLTERGFINYQSLCQLIMILWIVVACFTMVIAQTHFTPYLLIILIPPTVFFMTYFFLIIKRKWLSEILFFLTVVICIGLGYYSKHYLKFQQVYWIEKTDKNLIENKKILVLGKNFTYYYQNNLATPYLNWDLAQNHFSRLNYYRIVIETYENFKKDMPEVIIDEQGIMPALIAKMPLLANRYQTKEKGVYWLVK